MLSLRTIALSVGGETSVCSCAFSWVGTAQATLRPACVAPFFDCTTDGLLPELGLGRLCAVVVIRNNYCWPTARVADFGADQEGKKQPKDKVIGQNIPGTSGTQTSGYPGQKLYASGLLLLF